MILPHRMNKKYDITRISKCYYVTLPSSRNNPQQPRHVLRLSLGRRSVHLLPVQRTKALTNGAVDRRWVVGREP